MAELIDYGLSLCGGLGAEFTHEVGTAWAAAYGALSGAMIAAAYPES